MQTVDEMCALIRAEAEGKVIEFWGESSGEWIRKTKNQWHFDLYRYRIKPEPREFVIVTNHFGQIIGAHEANDVPGYFGDAKFIRVREVIGESEK